MQIRRLWAALAVVVGVLSFSSPAWAVHEGEFCGAAAAGQTAQSDKTGVTIVCTNVLDNGTIDPNGYRWHAQGAAPVTTTTAAPGTTTSVPDSVPPIVVTTSTVAPVVVTPTTVANGMPNTGVDSGKWATEALVLVVTGSGVIVCARRRRWPLR